MVYAWLLPVAVWTIATAHPASSQTIEHDALIIPKLPEEIRLDARIDEPAWQEAHRLTLVQHQPNFGVPPSERTEVLIGYTDDYLYAACRCYDRAEPSAPSFKRDFYSSDSDYFTLVLDTFNDNENGLAFETTPTGVRSDQAIFNDAAGDSPYDNDWNTVWDVEARQTELGWFVEIRIPISSLRFQDDGDRVEMGLIVTRYIARKNEIMVFPAIPPNWGGWSPWKPSQARDVAFRDLKPKRPLRVTPYLLLGGSRRHVLDTSGTRYGATSDTEYDGGLDLKYGLTSNFTLDLTVNTDFAQVEADDQEINLTRFPLFFPEKRRFFLERASNFAFDFRGSNRLFYSRRIGLQEGRPIRILGGARVVGRAGPWDVGLLSMQTGRASDLGVSDETVPSENFGVVRLRRRVLNPYSYVGGIGTSRIGLDGTYNIAYGLDGIVRIVGDEYVAAKWAQTFDDEGPAIIAPLAASRVLLQWERRRYAGLSYELSYARAGGAYEPGIGFELREDYFRLGDRLGLGWIPDGGSIIQRHRVDLNGIAHFRNPDGSLESLEIGPAWEMSTNRGHSFTLGVLHRIEDLRARFAISEDVTVPAGRYAFASAHAGYALPSGGTLRTGAVLTAGRFYDGWRAALEMTPTWNASRYFRMTSAYMLDLVGFPDRDEAFTSHIIRIRADVTPSVKVSLQAFVQYASAIDAVAANARLRYNPREGNDLYLVYNERLNTDRPLEDPRLPLSMRRVLLLKYTYTFNW